MHKPRSVGSAWLLIVMVLLGLRAEGDVSPAALRLHEQAIVVDTHIDTPQRLLDENFNLAQHHDDGHIDLPRMKEGGLDAGFMSIWIDMRRFKGTEATKRALQLIDSVYQTVQRYPDQLVLAESAEDVRRAHRQGKIAFLMGMEGGTPIANDLHLLRNFYRLGVRYMTLTHSLNNDWADSSTDEPAHSGLTEFGKEVVREMNRLGMLVDISHVSDEAFYDALEASEAPLIASHSSCRALCDHERNLSDEMIKALGKNGGVIQITFVRSFIDQEYKDAFEGIEEDYFERWRTLAEEYKDHPGALREARRQLRKEIKEKLPPVSWTRVVDHIDHAVELAGVDHVGLGSDFDGATMPDGLDDASYLPQLTQELLNRGYTEEEVRKILGENTLRILEEAEQVAARLRRSQAVRLPTRSLAPAATAALR